MAKRDTVDQKPAHAEVLLGLALTASRPPGACPDPESIAAWHDGLLDEVGGSEVEAHVAHCDNCYRLWTGLLDELETPEATSTTSEVPRTGVRHWLQSLLSGRTTALPVLAATVLAVIAGGILLTNFQGGFDPLPAYGLSMDGRTRIMRGTEVNTQAVAVFDQGNRFSLRLTPATAADGAVVAQLYLLRDDEVTLLEVPRATLTGKGTVHIEGTVGENVLLPTGESVLLVVVGRPSHLPQAGELATSLAHQDDVQTPTWEAWKIPVQVNE